MSLHLQSAIPLPCCHTFSVIIQLFGRIFSTGWPPPSTGSRLPPFTNVSGPSFCRTTTRGGSSPAVSAATCPPSTSPTFTTPLSRQREFSFSWLRISSIFSPTPCSGFPSYRSTKGSVRSSMLMSECTLASTYFEWEFSTRRLTLESSWQQNLV